MAILLGKGYLIIQLACAAVHMAMIMNTTLPPHTHQKHTNTTTHTNWLAAKHVGTQGKDNWGTNQRRCDVQGTCNHTPFLWRFLKMENLVLSCLLFFSTTCRCQWQLCMTLWWRLDNDVSPWQSALLVMATSVMVIRLWECTCVYHYSFVYLVSPR